MPPTPLQTADAQIASLGIGKETTFAVAVAPSLFHAYDSANFTPKRATVPRTGVTKKIGQRYPASGGFSGSASLDVESSPDTLGQLIAFAMGGQSAPTHAIVNTTLGVAIGATGVSFATPASMDGIFVGSSLTIDTAGNLEVVVVTAVTPTTFQANFTKTHLINVAIVLTSATAYMSKLTMATRLPTFTAEEVVYNVGAIGTTFALDHVGCKIDSMSLALDPKGGLKPKFSLVYASEFVQSSPATPSFSTKDIFTFENPNSMALYKGLSTSSAFAQIGGAGQVAVQNWDVTAANNLVKDYFSFGAGPIVADIPEGPRKFSGKIQLGFESAAQYTDFLGASTGPGIFIPGVAVTMVFVSHDLADATLGVPYAIIIKLPNLFLTQYSKPGKATGALDQTYNFEAAESAPGANDDMTVTLLNAAAAIY